MKDVLCFSRNIDEMKRWALLIILVSVLTFVLLPKPIVIGKLPDVDWENASSFVYHQSSLVDSTLGDNACFQRSLILRQEGKKLGISSGIVLGLRDGKPHCWNCFRCQGKVHYIEPQRLDWIWTNDTKPWYQSWIIIGG